MRCAQILGMKGVMTVDELRRGIEAIPEDEYHRLSYYRRWIRSITDNLLRKGVITEAELRAALERGDGDFAPGARAGEGRLAGDPRPLHIRTPHYLRGMRGPRGAPARRHFPTPRISPSRARPGCGRCTT